MTRRIISSVVLWLGIIAVLGFLRATGAVILIALATAFTLREFYQLQKTAGQVPFARMGMFFGALIAIAPWCEMRFGWPAHALLPLAVVVFSIRILSERQPESRTPALASTLFGLVYVALLMQYLTRIVTPLPGDVVSANGRLLLCVWVAAVAKFCDTGALLTGMACGKHPMAPRISPKKTWEGAVGGVLTSMLIGALFARVARGEFPPGLTPWKAALIAAPLAVIAIVSDLVESVIKRQAAIKDSGGSVPGIGGLFDVVDSILLVAPVAYFLLGFK